MDPGKLRWKRFWKRSRTAQSVTESEEHKCKLTYVRTEPSDDYLEFHCSRCGYDWAWSRVHIQTMFKKGKEYGSR